MNIRVQNLGKKYNREWIFRSLDLEIQDRQHLAIIGSNGSGKSTLLKILCNYLSPSEGSVSYRSDSRELKKDSAQLHFSLMAPYTNIISEFTVKEMIEFQSKFKSTQLTPEEILERSNLSLAASKLISELSSGMLQRLKLSLIFYFENEFVFLDEPTSNLDHKNTQWYHSQVQVLMRSQTVILASNQESEYEYFINKLNVEDHKFQLKSRPA